MAPLVGSIVVGAMVMGVVGCSSEGSKPKENEAKVCVTPQTIRLADDYERRADYLLSEGRTAEAFDVYELVKANDTSSTRKEGIDSKIANFYTQTGRDCISSALLWKDPYSQNMASLSKLKTAEELFVKAAGLTPSLKDGLDAELADAYVKMGRGHITGSFNYQTKYSMNLASVSCLTEAEERFAEAVRLNPALTDSLNVELADAYVQLGKGNIADALELRRQYSENASSFTWLATAKTRFAEAIRLNPSLKDGLDAELADAYVKMGKSFLESGWASSAKNIFDSLISGYPNLGGLKRAIAETCNEVGDSLRTAGKLDDAGQAYQLSAVYLPCDASGSK